MGFSGFMNWSYNILLISGADWEFKNGPRETENSAQFELVIKYL